MFLKNIVQVLKDKLTVTDLSDYFLFRTIGKSTRRDGTLVQKYSMHSSDFYNIYKVMPHRVSSKKYDKVLCNDNDNYLPLSFLCYLHVFSDKKPQH